ncbi:hypothetical protein GCM10018793_15280 [Streptomyces sulfonofaciens]|uniref:DUF5304 domain-containing protein n=1 Tax=Streptomyces sulfonofaciens TaxID=68272 RepID=A0A919KV46_9ACTN|nr:DUF5304 domain-containing protein [Streptomyces sulfonofaciens]GHH74335.1 hypothetical protein GCM10018793_15280 [Streptomyces sulfonofaciens]
MSEAAERPDLPEDPWETPGRQGRQHQQERQHQEGPQHRRDAAGGHADPDRERGTGHREEGRAGHDPVGPPDAGAWAAACAEDLAEEQARRRARYGPPPGSAAEELRRLVDAVADKLSGLSGAAAPLFGMAAQGAAQQVVQQAVRQARAAVDPVIQRNPDVFDHLAAAGSELLAAYRSAVAAQEQRWTRAPGSRRDGGGDHGGTSAHPDHGGHGTGPDRRDEGPGPGEHIDLD